MAFYDIFNGDADGLCGLHQLRLADPRDAILVTGTKREIALLNRVSASAGDRLTVLDIALDQNRSDLLRALEAGAHCQYFDHHYPGAIPTHPRLETHIEYAPDVCTSLIVDAYLGRRFTGWAVTAAFGDNLQEAARRAATPLGLTQIQLDTLRQLGECLNYNAYGDSLADLYFHPAELYRRMQPYVDPLAFVRDDHAFDTLRGGYAADMALAQAVVPTVQELRHWMVVLPDEPWSRRVSGALANHVAQLQPSRAHAVLVRKPLGYLVSVRAPLNAPTGADALCRRFAGGGGRPAAAGINRLAPAQLADFERAFRESFGAA
jgi:hypothetical protein